jgi:3-hydroxybutyryl-CoA dehydratase
MKALVQVGEVFEESVQLDADTVSHFAAQAHDFNPLHHDVEFARKSRFKRLIASGTHTISLLCGLAATHFSKRGVMLGLEFSQRLTKAIGADEKISLRWEVVDVTEKPSLAGWLVRMHGEVRNQEGELAMSSEGLVLVTATI